MGRKKASKTVSTCQVFGSSFKGGGQQRERYLDHRVILTSGHLVWVDQGYQKSKQLAQAGKAVRNEAPKHGFNFC